MLFIGMGILCTEFCFSEISRSSFSDSLLFQRQKISYLATAEDIAVRLKMFKLT
jgi:hypothetical protein